LFFLALFWFVADAGAAFFLLADPRPFSSCPDAAFGSAALTPSSFMKSAHREEDAAAAAPVVESAAAAAAAASSSSAPPRDLKPRPRTLIISSTASGGKLTFPELSWTESLSMSFFVPKPGATIGSWSRTRADRRVTNAFFVRTPPSPPLAPFVEVVANAVVGVEASDTVEREGCDGVETVVDLDPSSSVISNNWPSQTSPQQGDCSQD
jgi:hypothetical protein